MRTKKHCNDLNSGIDGRSLSDSSSVAGSDTKAECQKLTIKIGKTAALKVKKTSKKPNGRLCQERKTFVLRQRKRQV